MFFPSQFQVVLNSCVLGSSQEALAMMLRYFNGYTNLWDVFDIFAFNFGLIYDSVVDTITTLLAKAKDPTGVTNTMYLMFGYGLGNIFYLMFYPA